MFRLAAVLKLGSDFLHRPVRDGVGSIVEHLADNFSPDVRIRALLHLDEGDQNRLLSRSHRLRVDRDLENLAGESVFVRFKCAGPYGDGDGSTEPATFVEETTDVQLPHARCV